MQSPVMVIFDSKTNAYHAPFCHSTLKSAVRAFSDMIENTDHPFGKHPEDYTLFTLGTFDDATATYELDENKRVICNGLDVGNVSHDDGLHLHSTG